MAAVSIELFSSQEQRWGTRPDQPADAQLGENGKADAENCQENAAVAEDSGWFCLRRRNCPRPFAHDFQ